MKNMIVTKIIILMDMTKKYANIMTLSRYRWIILYRRTSQHHRSPDGEPGKCGQGVDLTEQQGEGQSETSPWDFLRQVLSDGRLFQPETVQAEMGAVNAWKLQYGPENATHGQPGRHNQQE